ncbi:MAG: hypothetical protein ACRD51_10580 [Candidatus Acidiferrum sp.]
MYQGGAASARDSQHDFDFEIGSWKTHLRRLQHPLSGSKDWVEYNGTSVVRKIWNGRANLVELKVHGPAGQIEGLSLRLYNPQSRQWSLYYANSNTGILGQATIGEFTNGRGLFFDQEMFNGRAILVRNVWSDITPNSCHFEQAFSEDGGATWETNWIATDTRIPEAAAGLESDRGAAAPANSPTNSGTSMLEDQKSGTERSGQHDFDFEVGSWNIHLKRLLRRFANSHEWVEFGGTSVTREVWHGRSQLEEFETDDPVGHTHIEGLTLRLYNPGSHQWRLYWATSKDGALFPPTIGKFKNGIGEFFSQDTSDGRYILVRFIWSKTTSVKPHFEQSFSPDVGKTWELNWITDQTRQK